MLRGLVTAVRTLSILPIPGRDADDMAASLPWFPVVGGLLGLFLFGLCLGAKLAGLAAWPEGVAFGVVVMGALLTRGLHLDGLADWADGFASMTDREQTLRIMKDSRIGTFGVLVLIAVLAAKWTAIIKLFNHGTAIWLIAAFIVSRTIQVELAASLPYARPGGGTASSFVQGARARHRFGAWIIATVCLFAVGPFGPLTLAIGLLSAGILRIWFKRRLEGVTGDLLGASSELVETLLLLLGAALGTRLLSYTGWESIL